VAGLLVAGSDALGERLAFYQNAVGGILGPQDSWLLLRGLKTLAVRIERQQESARRVAEWLARDPRVRRVYYPGLPGDPWHASLRESSRGFGAMVSFEVPILCSRRACSCSELGGVGLVTTPVQTADIDPATRERLGVNDRRCGSIGLEHIEDLIADPTRRSSRASAVDDRTLRPRHALDPYTAPRASSWASTFPDDWSQRYLARSGNPTARGGRGAIAPRGGRRPAFASGMAAISQPSCSSYRATTGQPDVYGVDVRVLTTRSPAGAS
jgi:cystathionine beta-lyase/cystathionine gamma-synthase